MSEIAWQRKLDGQRVIFCRYVGSGHVEVLVSDDYRVMLRTDWAALPIFWG